MSRHVVVYRATPAENQASSQKKAAPRTEEIKPQTHSQAVAERQYEKVTEDDYAEVTNQMPRDVGQTVGQSGGTLEASVRITDAEKPIKKPLLVLSEGSRSGMEYSWVDAFRTSLCSNSQKIADFLRRFADLDLVA